MIFKLARRRKPTSVATFNQYIMLTNAQIISAAPTFLANDYHLSACLTNSYH